MNRSPYWEVRNHLNYAVINIPRSQWLFCIRAVALKVYLEEFAEISLPVFPGILEIYAYYLIYWWLEMQTNWYFSTTYVENVLAYATMEGIVDLIREAWQPNALGR